MFVCDDRKAGKSVPARFITDFMLVNNAPRNREEDSDSHHHGIGSLLSTSDDCA